MGHHGTANGGAGINGGSVGVGSASSGSTSVTTSGISGIAGNTEVRTGDGSNGLTPSWVASELLKDVNAQVQITSTATGILVQLEPQLAEQLNVLLWGDSPSGRDRTRSEFARLKDDPSLTPEQKQQLQNLQSFYNAGAEAGYFMEPGGADTVVGGGGSANTPVVFAMAGVGATAAGTAAGAAAGAGLNGASGTNQGYRDPESGRWGGGSPPLTLPALGSLEQLAATNPVIGPIYRAYAAMWEAIGASNNVYAVPSGDPPVPGATPGRPTSGRASQWESSGGFDQANEDFDHLNPTDVRDYGNGVRVGTLPDGRSAVVRPTSSGERRPTREIQGPRPVKGRY